MSCKHTLTACCLLVTVVTVVAAADPVMTAGADMAASHRAAREADQKLQQSLHKKIQANWTDVPLSEVMQSIAKEAAANLWIDEVALSEDGTGSNFSVTLNLGETTIWTALHFLLPPHELEWTGQSGILEVKTKARANEQLVVRTYDVSAIAKVLEPQLESRGRSWRYGRGVPRPMYMGGMYSVPPKSNGATAEHQHLPADILAQFGGAEVAPIDERNNDVWRPIGESGSRTETALMQVLENCGYAKWMSIDQEGGAIAVLQGRLIVRQTYHCHFEIQSLLQAIEAILVLGVKAHSLQIRRPAYPQDEDAIVHRRLADPRMIDVQDQPLEDVLQTLAKSSGVRLWIDVQALNEDGVRQDQPVSLSHGKTPLNVILSHLLEPLGLVAIVEEGTLVVTTQSRADESGSVLVYNMADISGFTPEGVVVAVENCTGQKWMEIDQEGGALHFLGTQLLVVRQTQRGHAEIALLLDDLRRTSNPKQEPTPPKLEQRIYAVADATAIIDLLRSLPEMVPNWDAKRGSIHRLGQTIMVNQPPLAQDRVREIITVLNAEHARLHPPAPKPTHMMPGPGPTNVPPPALAPPAAAPPVPPAVPGKPADVPK